MVIRQCQTCEERGANPVPKVEAATESKARALLAKHYLAAGHAEPEGKQKLPFEHTCPEGHLMFANTAAERDELAQQHRKECNAP